MEAVSIMTVPPCSLPLNGDLLIGLLEAQKHHYTETRALYKGGANG